MDTGSHLLFGATLAGLAFLDPAVAGSPELVPALLTVTMVGSHAPDFDTVTRLKSYHHYLRYHRGITHSLPALAVWPLVLALPAAWAFGVGDHWGTLYLWSLAAVLFHVLLDWFNAYGVQCFRPFSEKWQHLDILPLFDPFLFALHSTGLLLWMVDAASPGPLFGIIYACTFLYLALRGVLHRAAVRQVKHYFGRWEAACKVVPGLFWNQWQFVLDTSDYYYTGKVRGRRVQLQEMYRKDRDHPAVQATLETDGVRAFLSFAQNVHVRILTKAEGYQVEWRDVRFGYDQKLPFGVDVKLDRDLKVRDERIGWNKKVWDPPYV